VQPVHSGWYKPHPSSWHEVHRAPAHHRAGKRTSGSPQAELHRSCYHQHLQWVLFLPGDYLQRQPCGQKQYSVMGARHFYRQGGVCGGQQQRRGPQ
jgi:hypothetical protein